MKKRDKKYAYVALRAKGFTPSEAVKKMLPNSSKQYAATKEKEMEEDEEVQALLGLFLTAEGATPDDIRLELTAAYLDDSRNEDLPIGARQKAREYLVKIYGLDVQKVNISTDDEFRNFLLAQTTGD